MTGRSRIVGVVLGLGSLLTLGPAPAANASVACKPYCDATTIQIAKRLNGTGHMAWLATVLDEGGYGGRRHAEITRIPKGHGKRYVGVIHVPAGKAKKARAALADFWFAQSGTKFVLPLVTKYNTDGGTAPAFKRAATYAKNRLGGTWKVH